MKKLIYVFLISIFTLGCNRKPESIKNSEPTKEKEVAVVVKEIPKIPASKPKFNLSDYTQAIDSIFKIQKSAFYTLTTIDFKNEERRNVLAFSQDGLKKVYKYGLFWILEFENPSKSKQSFNEIAKLFKDKPNERGLYQLKTKEGYSIMYDVISKGGASFTLKDNFIIQKLGSCSGTFEELVTDDEKLLAHIYRNSKSVSDYYFRYCCACSVKYKMEYK